MLRMKHKLHGFHHAYNGLEEKTMRENGWIGEDESFDPPEPKAEETTPQRKQLGRSRGAN